MIVVIIYSNYRPRSFLHHQFDQVPVPPTVYDPQGYNSMLPELSILARYLLIYYKCFLSGKVKKNFTVAKGFIFLHCRPPQLANYHQQPNQVWNTQNSLLPGSSMPSRSQFYLHLFHLFSQDKLYIPC